MRGVPPSGMDPSAGVHRALQGGSQKTPGAVWPPSRALEESRLWAAP